MSYFISPPDKTTWTMDAAAFVAHLRSSWPRSNVQLVEHPQSNHFLEWSMPMARGELDGSLDRTKQAVHLDGDIYDCAQFALWVRTQVPLEQPLVFYDEGYSADVALEPSTTVEALVRPFIHE